jgi:hypothetical protein
METQCQYFSENQCWNVMDSNEVIGKLIVTAKMVMSYLVSNVVTKS